MLGTSGLGGIPTTRTPALAGQARHSPTSEVSDRASRSETGGSTRRCPRSGVTYSHGRGLSGYHVRETPIAAGSSLGSPQDQEQLLFPACNTHHRVRNPQTVGFADRLPARARRYQNPQKWGIKLRTVHDRRRTVVQPRTGADSRQVAPIIMDAARLRLLGLHGRQQ